MRFEWDEEKRLSNIRSHEIDVVVETILDGETVTFLDDRFNYGENRFRTYGLLRDRVVVVTHTEADEVIRVISVRKATKNEERIYFKQIKD